MMLFNSVILYATHSYLLLHFSLVFFFVGLNIHYGFHCWHELEPSHYCAIAYCENVEYFVALYASYTNNCSLIMELSFTIDVLFSFFAFLSPLYIGLFGSKYLTKGTVNIAFFYKLEIFLKHIKTHT